MTDTNLIGRVLELQAQRITRLQQTLDKVTAQLDAQADTLERLHRSLTKETK